MMPPLLRFTVVLGALVVVAAQAPPGALAGYAACLLLWRVQAWWQQQHGPASGWPDIFSLAQLAPPAVAISFARWGFAHYQGFWSSVGIIAGFAALTLMLYALHTALAKAWRLPIPVSAMPQPITFYAHPSRDGKATWQTHPSGLRFHTEITGEIGMGGPPTSAHYFDNGIVLDDGSLSIAQNGRYAACTDVRSGSWITLVDFVAGRKVSWEDVGDARRLHAHGPDHASLLARLDGPDAVQLICRHGLWVAPDVELAPEHLTLDSPGKRHRLELDAIIDPTALHEMAEAVSYLRTPHYRVRLDGKTLPITTSAPADVFWSRDGDMLLVPARAESATGSHWLWCESEPGRWLTPSWNAELALPSAHLTGIHNIDAEGLELGFDMGIASGGGYPNRWRDTCSPSSFTYASFPRTWILGGDAYGRLDVVELPEPSGRCLVRLTWRELEDPYAVGVVESWPCAGPYSAIFEPLPTQPGDDAFFRVRAGAASAGHVRLFHLWSDCGRYLALQEDGIGAPDRFFVLNAQTGQRLDTAFRATGLQLNAFVGAELQVQAPIGCVPWNYGFGAFEPIGPLPSTQTNGDLAAPDDKALLMESWRFRVDASTGRIEGPLTKCVHIKQPPYPNAAFPFVYRSPDGQRWAYCFGGRGKFNDAWERGQESRYQACLITDNGICIEGLDVAMIWSADSRYLFIVTRKERADRNDFDWSGRVLDCRERWLHPQVALGGLPILEHFDADGIHYRFVDDDWWRDDLTTSPAHVPLAALLASPTQALAQEGERWLLAGASNPSEWARYVEIARAEASNTPPG